MDGILLLDKPKNMTSHDCVNKVRKIFKTKKVGHIGTLDPNVTGVLPICINDATKIIQFIEHTTKEYVAEISIGKSTTTEDSDGEVVSFNEQMKEIKRDELLSVLNGFLGEQKQIPPMISSIKVNGKKLYEYARKGIEVERPERTIFIHELELLSTDEVYTGVELIFKIRILCSKGTYIRTIATDIGKKLGFPSHMKSLIRTQSGPFTLNQCNTFEEIENNQFELISMYDALSELPYIEVNDFIKQKILNGRKLENRYSNFKHLVFCDKDQQLLAIYEIDQDPAYIKPSRVFSENRKCNSESSLFK